MIRRLLLFFFITIASLAFAGGETQGPVKLVAKVNKAIFETDEEINFQLVATYPKDFIVELQEVQGALKGLDIVDFGRKDENLGAKKKLIKWYKIKAQFSGHYVIESIKLKYKNTKGSDGLVESSPLFLEAKKENTGPEEESKGDKQKDIIGIKPIYESSAVWPWFLLGIVLVGIFVMSIIWWLKSRPRPKPLEKVIPCHIWAREELQKLEGLLTERGQKNLKNLAFKMSFIARGLIERRFEFMATDKTFEEIKRELRGQSFLQGDELTSFLEVLEKTDRVKFADYLPTIEENKEIYKKIEVLIDYASPVINEDNEDSVI